MINGVFLLISAVLLNIFNVATMTLNGNFIKRTFLEMPINVVKRAIVIDTRFDPQLEMHFDIQTLEKDVKNYLSTSLENKAKSYKIAFTYFNFKPDGKLDFDIKEKPQNVQIAFNCKYFRDYEINEHLLFKALLK